MLVFSSLGLVLDNDFDKFKQSVQENFAEAVFDAIFPALQESACSPTLDTTPACSLTESIYWNVKMLTSGFFIASIAGYVYVFIQWFVERYRDGIETAIDIIRQILEGYFIILPSAGVEALIHLVRRDKDEY